MERRELAFRMQGITPRSINHKYEEENTHRLSKRNCLETKQLPSTTWSQLHYSNSYHQSRSNRGNTEGKNNTSFPNNLIIKAAFFQVGKLKGDV